MSLKGPSIVNVACPDGELEISELSESFLKKPVDFFPAAPIHRRWLIETRREHAHFEHELAEDRRRDA